MEIHLILEGEQVGPLSEAQVRQYLDDGLVTTTDLATYEGMEDWMPLEQILAQLPPYAPLVDSAAAAAVGVEPAESSFLVPNGTAGASDENLNATQEIAQSLTASQRTRRKLGKIVIQPILPLETTLPQKRRTGKTALTLEPLRSTISLPPITGHLPRPRTSAKGTGRTGKVSLRAVPQVPVSAPTPEPEPVAITADPIAPVAPIEPVAPHPTVESITSTATPVESIAPEIPPKPTAPPEVHVSPEPVVPAEATASQKLPDPRPVFSVMPKGSGFMPPTMRSVNPPMRRRKSLSLTGARRSQRSSSWSS